MRKMPLLPAALLLSVLFLSAAGCRQEISAAGIAGKEANKEGNNSEVVSMIENIKWLGHASFRLTGEKTVYIDPWKIKGGDKADIILITHEHYDHCSPEDVAKITKNDTVIVAVADCQSKLLKLDREIRLVEPGKKLNIRGVLVEAVPAYNINKRFHPKDNQWVGYVVTINGKRIYHAGDTDLIPEMSQLKGIDVALLPVGGTYTMNADEAAKAAEIIRPKVAVPMHVGDIVGTKKDIERFKSLSKVPVEVLKEEE